jgi:ribonuclease HIII
VHDELIAGGLIGTDEAGKGDYFGPLVCAACYVDGATSERLESAGVKDSKRLSNKRVQEIAIKIKTICPHNIVAIGPSKYNDLYAKMKNLNRLLAWAHARTIENILAEVNCQNVLTDQFGDERLVLSALQDKGKKVNLIQRTKAEQNQAVAAASILARDGFLSRMAALSKEFGMTIPLGAGAPVDEALAKFVKMHGREKLGLVAKIHFRNTSKVLG